MPGQPQVLIIYAIVIIAYFGFTAFIVWVLSSKVPTTMGRTLLAVAVLVGGLPPILLALVHAVTG